MSVLPLNVSDHILFAIAFVLTIIDGWLVTRMKEARGDGQTLTVLTHVCLHRLYVVLYEAHNALTGLIAVVIQFPDRFFILPSSSSFSPRPLPMASRNAMVSQDIVIVIALLSSLLFVST